MAWIYPRSLKALKSICAGLKSIYVIAAGCSIRFSPGALRHPAVSARFLLLCPPAIRRDESTLFHARFSCRFKSFLNSCLKTGFQQVFTSVSNFSTFPGCCAARSGERADRAAALMHGPHAPCAQLRRLLQLRAGDLPCQLPPRVLPPLHGPPPSCHGDNAEPHPPGYAAQLRRHIRPALPPLHPHRAACKRRQRPVQYMPCAVRMKQHPAGLQRFLTVQPPPQRLPRVQRLRLRSSAPATG